MFQELQSSYHFRFDSGLVKIAVLSMLAYLSKALLCKGGLPMLVWDPIHVAFTWKECATLVDLLYECGPEMCHLPKAKMEATN